MRRSPSARSCSSAPAAEHVQAGPQDRLEWYKIGKVFASVERIDDLLDRKITVTDLPGAVATPPLEDG